MKSPAHLIRFILAIALGTVLSGHFARAASCTDAGCVQVSGRLASIDTNRSILLNALVGRMLDSNLSFNFLEWQSLANGNINLLDLLNALQANASLGSPTEAFNTSVSAVSFFQAAATVMQAKGQTLAANVLNSISAQVGLGSIRLGDLFDLCSSCSNYADVSINVLDLVSGSAELFNYQNAVITHTPVTISGASLGILSFGNILLYVQVCEPPRIVCGGAGAQFYGATIRLKLDIALANVDLTTSLAGLNLLSLHAQLTHLTVYVAIARVQGSIQTVDALASAVTVQAKPGLVDLYIGSIDDSIFYNRTHTIDPVNDVQPGVVGALQLTVLTVPITAAILAKATGEGAAPYNTNLVFNGPFPQKQTVSSGIAFSTNLISSLLGSLKLSISVDGLGLLSTLLQDTINGLLSTISPVLTTVVGNTLLTPVGTLLGSIVDPLLSALGIRIGEADIIVLGAHRGCSYSISGYVYRDANRNGFRDVSEAGTGLALFAKLIPASATAGPATQWVAVNSTTGVYSFSGVLTGKYTVVLSSNNTLSDIIAATIPTGWTMTEQITRIRSITVATADVPDQNFGYAPFSSIAGLVFRDTGTSGGTANDGVSNGGEIGLSGVTVRLLDATNVVLDSTQTAADGTYLLYLPSTLTTGAIVRVIETNPVNAFSTGGSVGTTGGLYVRTTDTVTFTHTAGASYTGVNFGDVPLPQLIADGQQSTTPGTTVYYAHQFIAGSPGQVQFTLTPTQAPTIAGWTETLYLDNNGNGQIDAGEPIINGAITVTEGQVLNLVLKVFAPVVATNGARDSAVLNGLFAFTGSTPPLNLTLLRTDLTLISGTSTAGLKLIKTVDKAQAKPGDTITYTITFTNESSGPLRTVVVSDETPAFTTFVSAGTGTLPTGFTLGTLTKPSVGAKGPLSWNFNGDLASAASGTVNFAVLVDQ